MRRWLVIAGVLIVIGWWLSPPSGRVQPPGVLAPDVPEQTSIVDGASFAHDTFRITPLAEFRIDARVLGRETYRFDAGAVLAPIDLALGWGRMSDSDVIERLVISQSGRWYSYRWGAEGPPLPPAEIRSSSANMHLIPADAGVAGLLDKVRVGDLVRIEGKLVQADGEDGWHWRSSLTREDSGGGACELIWVESVTLR